MTFLKLTLISSNIQRRGKTGEKYSDNESEFKTIFNFVIRSEEEKDKEKAENDALIEEYGF